MNLKMVQMLLISIGMNYLLCLPCRAQKDSAVLLQEVVVSGLKITKPSETPINISSLSVKEMRRNGSLNISDALAKLPGISQISTGLGISKPVIRGLYGNRVMAIISGLRFDNQQWQDEHGLGLNELGIDRVEIIKGPVSLLYGSEAIGGIINIIEETPAVANTRTGEFNTRFFSNTYGIQSEIGFKGATEKHNWRIRGGISSHSDYGDGNNKRVLNSRFGGYYLKGSYGFNKKNWTSSNNYNASLDNFGFITLDNMGSKKVDGRLSRTMDGPHHSVLLNTFSSQNTIRLQSSTLKFNSGLQSNLRLENEGGNRVSLEMLLSTLLYNLQWIKPVNNFTEIVAANQFIFENNTNLGSRKIIPDANMIESGGSVFMKKGIHRLIFESGIGITIRNIKTFETIGVNDPSREILPFNKTKPSVNGAAGISYNPSANWNFKVNISSGFRSGNLAELSSNGLHEGTLRWEIGDPDLKIEQNINCESSVNYNGDDFSFYVSAFYNRFYNYIFLNPSGVQYFGFDVYNYKQAGADLAGGEATFSIHPLSMKWLTYSSSFSTVTGKLSYGGYLPFIPANKLQQELVFHLVNHKKIKESSITVQTDHVSGQNHPARFETSSRGYMLLNIGGMLVLNRERKITFSLMGNNILNKNYFDHLSRFKEYGIHNIGRNISLNINYPFLIKKKIKS
ncbi:MAG: TonB-dependent receptor [Ginsengibacter sp.]